MNHFFSQLALLTTLIVFLSSCSNQDIKSVADSVIPCSDKQYTATDSFESVEGKIIRRTRTGANPAITLYYIEAPKVANWIAIAPCNLPENVKQDGLEITFSGHLVTYPGFEKLNLEALPFELTDINVNKQ